MDGLPQDMSEDDVSRLLHEIVSFGSGCFAYSFLSPCRSQRSSSKLTKSPAWKKFALFETDKQVGGPNSSYNETIGILMDILLAEVSRGLGFLRFRTIDYASDFLERNHPCIYLYGPTAGENDRSTKVRIAYSREREDRSRAKADGDWTCRMV